MNNLLLVLKEIFGSHRILIVIRIHSFKFPPLTKEYISIHNPHKYMKYLLHFWSFVILLHKWNFKK